MSTTTHRGMNALTAEEYYQLIERPDAYVEMGGHLYGLENVDVNLSGTEFYAKIERAVGGWDEIEVTNRDILVEVL